MIVNIQVRAFSSNKLQLFSYTIMEDYPTCVGDAQPAHIQLIYGSAKEESNIYNKSKR